jgi:hypothetical protein
MRRVETQDGVRHGQLDRLFSHLTKARLNHQAVPVTRRRLMNYTVIHERRQADDLRHHHDMQEVDIRLGICIFHLLHSREVERLRAVASHAHVHAHAHAHAPSLGLGRVGQRHDLLLHRCRPHDVQTNMVSTRCSTRLRTTVSVIDAQNKVSKKSAQTTAARTAATLTFAVRATVSSRLTLQAHRRLRSGFRRRENRARGHHRTGNALMLP